MSIKATFIITMLIVLVIFWIIMMAFYRVIFATVGILAVAAAMYFTVKVVIPTIEWVRKPRLFRR